MEFLVVIFLDGGDLFSDTRQLTNLIFYLVLKQAHLVLQIFDAKLIEHDNIVVSMLPEQALEADGAQIVLAKGLDFLCRVDLTPAILKLSNLVVTHFHSYSNIIILLLLIKYK